MATSTAPSSTSTSTNTKYYISANNNLNEIHSMKNFDRHH